MIREAVPANGSHAAQPEIVTTYSGDFSVGANQMPIRTKTVKTTTSGNLTLTSSVTEDEKGRTLSKTDVNPKNVNGAQFLSVDNLPSGDSDGFS